MKMKHEKAWFFLAMFGHGNLAVTLVIAFVVRLLYDLRLVAAVADTVATALVMYGLACYGVSLAIAYFLDKHEERNKRKEVN